MDFFFCCSTALVFIALLLALHVHEQEHAVQNATLFMKQKLDLQKNKKPTHACMGNRWRGDYFCSGLSICAACKSSAQLLFTLVQCAV